MNSHTLGCFGFVSLLAIAGCGAVGAPEEALNVDAIQPALAVSLGGLVGTQDYSDTFTVGGARPDRLHDDNHGGAYTVESVPSVLWQPQSHFSFNTPGSSGDPGRVGAASGNTGAWSGLAQSGGSDFSIAYGKRQNYTVQADAILPDDRFDISSLPYAGAPISTGSSLSVFFRRNGTGLPGIGLYNGTKETDIGVKTGITDSNWHNFAVNFDQVKGRLVIFVDGVQKADLVWPALRAAPIATTLTLQSAWASVQSATSFGRITSS